MCSREKSHGWTRDVELGALKNSLRTARGSTNKKLFFLLCRFLMFYSILLLRDCLFWLEFKKKTSQKPPNLSKIKRIVRFDTWNVVVHVVDPISGGRAMKPAVQWAHNKASNVCGNCGNCCGVWRAGQKLGSRRTDLRFHVKTTPPYTPNSKSSQNSLKYQFLIFQKAFRKYSACSMKLSPSGVQNTLFDPGVTYSLIEKKFKTGPKRF